MYATVKPLLFKIDAESAHKLTITGLNLASRFQLLSRMIERACGNNHTQSPIKVMGINFPNPVGLAAGLDKDAVACNALSRLGFGWLELGTVTPKPQPGNPRPRMFRLTDHQAIINRMGFNSVGLDIFLKNISRADADIIKGINIGKNASTPMSNAVNDYLAGLKRVFPFADYVTINISSPNTKNLRDLQEEELLNKLLRSLNAERQKLSDQSGKRLPLVLKISPDISSGQVSAICQLMRKHTIDGLAATNTTVARRQVENHPLANEVGGLSGKPLQLQSTKIIGDFYQNLQEEIPIIAIGGIHNAQSAKEKIEAGAKLIQLYTGFIYQGPGLIQDILASLKQ